MLNLKIISKGATCHSQLLSSSLCEFIAYLDNPFSYYFSSAPAYTSRPHSRDSNLANEESSSPISEQIFRKSPNLGSYRQGDSTFYSLISHHANSGDFSSLEKILDRMKREHRSVNEKSFIAMFKAYGKAHLPEKAVELFHRMVNEFHCRPSVRSFNSVLNVIIQEGLFARAMEFYHNDDIVKRLNILPNALSYNLMTKALCRLGHVDRAIEMFREMPFRNCNPDVFTYCTLMDGLCKEGRIDEAVSLLDEMQVEGCVPNAATFNVLINGLCKKGDMVRASKLVDNMLLKGCVPNEVTYNTLLHGLCLKGKMEKAISLLDWMLASKCIPNDVTYGTIINGLVKQGRSVDAVALLISMEERGLQANEYIYSALISGLFREGKSNDAMRLWKEMIERGCKPNIIVYGALIDGVCEEGKLDEAKEIVLEMSSKGCIPNAFTCSSLMKGFFKMGNSQRAMLLWEEMKESFNEVCYSVLIDGLCKDGKLNEGMIVWKHMLERGCKPDLVAYSLLIHGHCNSGAVEQGLKLFNEMLCQEPESQPDIVIYNILFSGLCKQGSIARAVDLLNGMLDQGCDPDLITCNIFLKALREKLDPTHDGREFLDELVLRLCKRRRFAGASKIIEVMLQKFLIPRPSTWEWVLRGICRPKRIRAAIDKWPLSCCAKQVCGPPGTVVRKGQSKCNHSADDTAVHRVVPVKGALKLNCLQKRMEVQKLQGPAFLPSASPAFRDKWNSPNLWSPWLRQKYCNTNSSKEPKQNGDSITNPIIRF
ncbi:Pentatricopeptide repeat [Dillenia turbinata]|uniref:Pentatricopeptide repeat n=1 Tax=Dillenia turbinata TaxID=194707 RepID=A0AAN8UW34_9MAGN